MKLLKLTINITVVMLGLLIKPVFAENATTDLIQAKTQNIANNKLIKAKQGAVTAATATDTAKQPVAAANGNNSADDPENLLELLKADAAGTATEAGKEPEASSTNPELDQKKIDPFAPVNRKIFKFNKVMDGLYLKPVSMTYNKILPKPVKAAVGNFFSNIGEVPSGINQILQGEFKLATISVMRLIVNSTFGILGLFDIATPVGFNKTKSDFGQTMHKLGYKNSRYLVLPFFGPSTVRDSVGLAANNFITVPYYLKPKWRNRCMGLNFIHMRSELQDAVDLVKQAGVDEYVLMRDAYLQRKNYLNKEQQQTGAPSVPAVLEGPPS